MKNIYQKLCISLIEGSLAVIFSLERCGFVLLCLELEQTDRFFLLLFLILHHYELLLTFTRETNTKSTCYTSQKDTFFLLKAFLMIHGFSFKLLHQPLRQVFFFLTCSHFIF